MDPGTFTHKHMVDQRSNADVAHSRSDTCPSCTKPGVGI